MHSPLLSLSSHAVIYYGADIVHSFQKKLCQEYHHYSTNCRHCSPATAQALKPLFAMLFKPMAPGKAHAKAILMRSSRSIGD